MWMTAAIAGSLFVALLGMVYFAVRDREAEREREERVGPTPR